MTLKIFLIIVSTFLSGQILAENMTTIQCQGAETEFNQTAQSFDVYDPNYHISVIGKDVIIFFHAKPYLEARALETNQAPLTRIDNSRTKTKYNFSHHSKIKHLTLTDKMLTVFFEIDDKSIQLFFNDCWVR